MQPLHDWHLSAPQARQLQRSLAGRVKLVWDGRRVEKVGGVDVWVGKESARCAIAVLRFPGFEPLHHVTVEVEITYPYRPGLLAFREGPAVLEAWEQLALKPDVLLFDGQGIAHPRGLGLAAHLGLWLDLPTVGVAKSWLYGRYTMPPSWRGASSPLYGEGSRVIGAVLRTRAGVKPLFVSPGHLIDVATAASLTLDCCPRYRLPEPLRAAHHLAATGAS